MDNSGKFIITLFVVLVVFAGCKHCQEVSQGPTNSTVLSGSQARFNCTLKGTWNTIIWSHLDNPVLVLSRNQGILESIIRFSADNYTEPGVFISELIFSGVQVSDAGKITCYAFAGNFNAFLSVQVNGTLHITTSDLPVMANERVQIVCQATGWLPAPQITWTTNTFLVDSINYSTLQSDGEGGLQNAVSTLNMSFAENETVTCLASIKALRVPQTATVSLRVLEKPVEANKSLDTTTVIIIAVVVTVGGLILIALIVLLVICCCRRRKKEESTYQSQMKKVSAQRTNDLSIISKNVSGSANLGYDDDPPAYRRPLPRVPSVCSDSSNSLEAEQMYVGNRAYEVQRPYYEPQYPEKDLHLSRPAQVRHLTHV